MHDVGARGGGEVFEFGEGVVGVGSGVEADEDGTLAAFRKLLDFVNR
jgi:hypothetical protein